MKIVAIMPCRNEDWILGLSARAVLLWADELVILNHASTDGTRDICMDLAAEFGGRLIYLEEPSPVWEEMRHRQMLLDAARRQSPTHIAMIDADEILTANLVPVIREKFELTRSRVLQIPWLCLRGSIGRVHISGPWADGQNVSTGFMDSPELHWSSAGRGGYDFHHRHPMGRQPVPYQPVPNRLAGLMHLQFVSARRLRAKQALYKMTELLRWPGREPVHIVNQRYNLAVYGNHSGLDINFSFTLGNAPVAEWWAGYGALARYFHPEAEPWQEAEVNRLIGEHGRNRFMGLDLFGVGESTHG